MGLFDKIFGGSGKISVQFIDNLTGETIGISEMKAEQLPETFSVPTTFTIHDVEWTVEQAIPRDAAEFTRSKQLILKLRKIEYVDPSTILFTLPTISNELPATTVAPLFNAFEINIREDDWRQNEFLNRSAFPLIDIEVARINDIWKNNSKEVDASFSAFDKCHVRDTIGMPALSLSLQQLQDVLDTEETGSLLINDRFVEDGFSLRTAHTTYYGTLENNRVTQFCISQFTDATPAEIKSITSRFDLVFISWYHCDIITGDD